MTLCQGNLRLLLSHYDSQSTRISKPDLKVIYDQIVSGMAFIHGKKIVHRDLKPSNILMKINESKVKEMSLDDISSMIFQITDLGLSRQLDAERSKTLSVVGNNDYKSPG